METEKGITSTTQDQDLQLDIRSIDQAEELVVGLSGTNAERETRCYQIVDSIIRNRNANIEITGTSDAFHNFSVSLIKIANDYLTAWEIIQLGLKLHFENTDLLADAIRYGYNCGKRNECKQYYQKLKDMGFTRWTSRAFSFVIDYLLYISADIGGDAESKDIEKAIFAFKSMYPKDENSRYKEFEWYNSRNDKEKAIEALRVATVEIKSCPKCQLRYADIMVDQGEYELAGSELVKLCENENARDSISMSYAFYLKGCCQLALMKGKPATLFSKPEYDKEEVLLTYDSFRMALSERDLTERIRGKIVDRVNYLFQKTKVDIPEELAAKCNDV